jgi:hypothetical protein
MQFGLRTILVLPVLWLFALLLAMLLEGLTPSAGSWRYARYTDASSAVGDIHRWAILYRAKADRDLAFSDYDTTDLLSSISSLRSMTDPWGKPYRFIDLDRQPDLGTDSRFHAYSTGEDGVTHSFGNDPDDINSWDPRSHSKNISRLNEQSRTAMYLRSIWFTPILLGVWFYRCRHPRPSGRRRVGEIIANGG